MVVYDPRQLLYVYEWQFPSGDPRGVTTELVRLAGTHMPHSAYTQHMQESNLHCTAHVACDGDRIYEEDWFRPGQESDRLTTRHMYWKEGLGCAVDVVLPDDTCRCVFNVSPFVPHISLAEDTNFTMAGSRRAVFTHQHR